MTFSQATMNRIISIIVCCLLTLPVIADTIIEAIEIPELLETPSRVWVIEETITKEVLNCMALNIYFEARGEPIEGQYAVGDVVMYRVMHYDYPNTICGVIKDGIYSEWNPKMPRKHKCAFSWWCDRKSDVPVDGQAFELAMNISIDILTNPIYEATIDYAIFYHARSVEPRWAKRKKLVTQIGEHYFYR